MSGFYKMIALLFAVSLISPTLAANIFGITPFYLNRLELGEPEQHTTPEPEQDPFVQEEENPVPVQLLNPYVGDEKTPVPEQDPFVREGENLLNPYVGDEKNPVPVQLLNLFVGDEDGDVFAQAEEYNPLDHYPYVVDPFDGFGPSSNEEHKEHPRNPEDQYPYVNDPYP